MRRPVWLEWSGRERVVGIRAGETVRSRSSSRSEPGHMTFGVHFILSEMGEGRHWRIRAEEWMSWIMFWKVSSGCCGRPDWRVGEDRARWAVWNEPERPVRKLLQWLQWWVYCLGEGWWPRPYRVHSHKVMDSGHTLKVGSNSHSPCRNVWFLWTLGHMGLRVSLETWQWSLV